MKKYIMFLSAILVSGGLSAQNGLKMGRTSAVQNFDESSFFSSSAAKAEGSVYLYKDWDKSAIVHPKEGQKIVLNKANYNIQDGVFQSYVGDSLFTFRINNIEKVVLNNKTYKNVYRNGKNNVYEVIYESDNISIYKEYRVEIIAASNDPMVSRTSNKYSQNKSYYSKVGSNYTSFRLNKKGVLELLDEEDKTDIQKFVKKNKLSFKRENDLVKIFNQAFNN